MIKTLKNTTIKLSMVAALALTPSAVQAASGSAAMEGSSESLSAMIEPANVEQQLNRINQGINLIRLNTDIIEGMPIAADSEWVNLITKPLSKELYMKITSLKEIKNDPYYSTVGYTNAILGRPAITMTPITIKLYTQLAIIYKNKTNTEGKKVKVEVDGKIIEKIIDTPFTLPNQYVFPDISSPKTYVKFQDDKNVAVIDVDAVNDNRYTNVKEAVISLTPEDMQEEINTVTAEYEESKNLVAKNESSVAVLEAWLDNDENINNPQKTEKTEALNVAKVNLEQSETILDTKEEMYFNLLESAADAIAANYDSAKVPLAKQLEKLLDIVDNNAIRATSLFTAATAHIAKNGIGTLDKEIIALTQAQAISSLVGNQKEFIAARLSRMATGALLAIPNIGFGTYYAAKQISLAGKYQGIVNAILEGDKAAQEANAAKAEAAAEAKAKQNK